MPFNLPESQLIACEKKLNNKLPEHYRNAMRLSNGGELETDQDDWQLHPIADTTDRKRIARSTNHIIKETQLAKQWQGFPQNAISIATNSCGDHLVLLITQNKIQPPIHIWSHETSQLTKIANNFSQLEQP